MADHQNVNHQIWRAASITVALAACLIFGIIVLTGGDWIPGGIIVAASTVGLAREIPVIRLSAPPDRRPRRRSTGR